jgi:hypothetical protein
MWTNPFVADLANTGSYYFLSRPRRFGKSLFPEHHQGRFPGQAGAVSGLYLESNWDWDAIHPVVHISFGSGVVRSIEELQVSFDEILYDHQKAYELTYAKDSRKGRFAELIQTLHDRYNRKVVVLVDEYDKPILDNIGNPELARKCATN